MDPERGTEIEDALASATKDSRAILSESDASNDRLRYGLLLNDREIQSFITPYRHQGQRLAAVEKELLSHALTCTSTFFQNLAEALHTYFDKKQKLIEQYVNEHGDAWYTGIADAMKQIFRIRPVVKKALDEYLDAKQLTEDVGTILGEVEAAFLADWRKCIDDANVEHADAIAGAAASSGPSKPRFEFGAAEQTFAAGMGAAVIGTASLAAGWHTVAYSLTYVFWPVALAVLVATIATAVATKKGAQQKRLEEIRRAVGQLERTYVTLLYTEKNSALGNKTLWEYVENLNKSIIEDAMARRRRTELGKLRPDCPGLLIDAADSHLRNTAMCLGMLDEQEGQLAHCDDDKASRANSRRSLWRRFRPRRT